MNKLLPFDGIRPIYDSEFSRAAHVELVDGSLHPTKVGWFKHVARTSFTLDGGRHPEAVGYDITPGTDFQFMPNYAMPYLPTAH